MPASLSIDRDSLQYYGGLDQIGLATVVVVERTRQTVQLEKRRWVPLNLLSVPDKNSYHHLVYVTLFSLLLLEVHLNPAPPF